MGRSSSGSSRRLRAFKRWMKRVGIECSDALELRDEGLRIGICVRALGDLKEGDVVARIPKLTCLTIRTSAALNNFAMAYGASTDNASESGDGGLFEFEEGEGLAGLAVALMFERSLGERSRWAPYLELLSNEGESLPLVWSAEEVEGLLRGTELEGTIKEDKAIMWKEWKKSIEPLLLHLISSVCDSSNPNPPNRSRLISFQHYLATKTLISSRSFQIDDYHGIGMVPLADLFNHKTGAEDVHLMTSPHESESESESSTRETNNESSTLTTSTTSNSPKPIHDDDNISASSNGDGDGDGEKDNDSESDDDLEMTMVKDVKLGAEVFNTYGSLGNAALLHRYGFTEPDNPYDIVNIDLELILQWSSFLFSGQHRRARLSFWRRFDYAGSVSHNSEYFEISFNGEPQIEMLLLLYIMLLPDDAYYKKDLALATAGGPDDEPVGIIFSDKSALLSEDLLLTKSVCNALSSLADIRDRLYGTDSIEDDIAALGRCCCLGEKKLYHSLMLRISERRILQKLKLYAAKEASVSARKKMKRK